MKLGAVIFGLTRAAVNGGSEFDSLSTLLDVFVTVGLTP
jgi:hypothetical protein